ncbi:MAG: type II toxin-antitoxin system VapC family toxin [Deltaproteobacteria bacterium]|nr:type II toxin-antitoxin system VapC family toxin [Deltaproteobacteria bacterium]MBN2672609.1 type II toxin-antitoxin system VapC family toxin [Deltaproteobacteria bacterium]
MRVAFDTNFYVSFVRGKETAVAAAQQAHQIVLPFIVVAELRAGFSCGTRSAKNNEVFTRFLNRSRVFVSYPDEGTTHHYANLFRQLRQQGTPIPSNDVWIAALCVQHNLILASGDSHFNHLPQIPRYSPE